MERFMSSRGLPIRAAILCALSLLAGWSTSAIAGQINVTSYDLYNGGIGGYGSSTFYDDSYTGSGDKTKPYVWLSAGLGDLTDGVAASQNWSDQNQSQNLPYVAWNNGDSFYAKWPNAFLPFVTFHFGTTVNIDDVKINMNYGYRSNPVDFSMGGVTKTDSVSNVNSGAANNWYDFPNLGLTGDTLTVTFHYNETPADWILLSEVQFYPPASDLPEPASILLLGLGLVGLLKVSRSRK